MLQKLHSSRLTSDKETVILTLKPLDPVGFDRRKRQKLTRRESDKETVILTLKPLDPVGVDRRKSQKLTRREYHSFGPNHTLHIDGYDKLKLFRIAIHGAYRWV